MLIAAVLLVLGLAALTSAHETYALFRPLAGVLLVIAAIVVVLGPWWLRSPVIWWSSARPGSGPRSGPTWPRGCTTRCCKPSR